MLVLLSAANFLLALAINCSKKPPGSARGLVGHNQIDQALCFRFLRQPSRPNAPKPVAKSGLMSALPPKADMCSAQADVR